MLAADDPPDRIMAKILIEMLMKHWSDYIMNPVKILITYTIWYSFQS